MTAAPKGCAWLLQFTIGNLWKQSHIKLFQFLLTCLQLKMSISFSQIFLLFSEPENDFFHLVISWPVATRSRMNMTLVRDIKRAHFIFYQCLWTHDISSPANVDTRLPIALHNKTKMLPVPWLFHVTFKTLTTHLKCISDTFYKEANSCPPKVPTHCLIHSLTFSWAWAGCCFLMPIMERAATKMKDFKGDGLLKEHFSSFGCIWLIGGDAFFTKLFSLFVVKLRLSCTYSDCDLEESSTLANREFNLPTMLRGSWSSPADIMALS